MAPNNEAKGGQNDAEAAAAAADDAPLAVENENAKV